MGLRKAIKKYILELQKEAKEDHHMARHGSHATSMAEDNTIGHEGDVKVRVAIDLREILKGGN